MNTSSNRAREVFLQAIELQTPEDRAAFLKRVCQDDTELSVRVERLLKSHELLGSFHEQSGSSAAEGEHGIDVVPGDTIGPYKLREQIGEGGMGVVYVAEQTEPVKRKVALKIIKPGMASRDVVARFEAERQALAMMDHPHIAKVFDAGTTGEAGGRDTGDRGQKQTGDEVASKSSPSPVPRSLSPTSGQPYFVMELVQGPPITEYCDQLRLNTRQRLELFEKVCRTVQHAHQKGIIHRDLKPSNVLVPRIDGEPVPKVIDFGVAKAVGQKITEQTVYTQFTQLVGTPLYMSPEQAEFGVVDIDTRSDVYSLGVLLYELLTGSTPFDSETLKQAGFDEMRRIIREDEPPRPSARISTLAAQDLSTVAEQRGIDPRQLGETVKGELDWLVMKALEKDRNRRYESASALAEDVNRYLQDEPIVARPTSLWYRMRKFASRNRALVASLIAVVTALSLGAFLAIAGLLLALQQRDIARQAGEDLRLQLEETKAANAETEQAFSLMWQLLAKRGTGSQPQTYTVREAMDRLEEGLAEQLKGQPEVEIKFRTMLATNYHRSGDHVLARAHLDRALQVAQGLYGDDSETVADIYVDIANILDNRGTVGQLDVDEYAVYAQRAIAIYEARGTRNWGASQAWFLLSLTLTKPGERERRIKCLEKAIEMADAAKQNTDPGQLVYARTDLAQVLRQGDQNDVERAKALYSEASRIMDEIDETGDYPTVRAHLLETQAYFYYERDPDRARRLFYEAWKIYLSDKALKLELRGHLCALGLANFEFLSGGRSQARKVIGEVEAIAEEHDLSNSMAECCRVRGWMHLVEQEYADAIQSFEDALHYAERAGYGDAHVTTAFSQFYLAEALRRQGRIEDARKHYQAVERFTHPYLEMEDPAVEALWTRACSLLYSEVNPSHDDLKSVADVSNRALQRVPDWQKPQFYLTMAIAQHGLGDLKSAIASLQTGLNTWSGTFPSIHDRPYRILTSTSELRETLEKYKQEKTSQEIAHQQDSAAADVPSESPGDVE